MAETRGSNSRWVGRYGASSDHKNEIPPLHEGVPGEFGLSFFGLLYISNGGVGEGPTRGEGSGMGSTPENCVPWSGQERWIESVRISN